MKKVKKVSLFKSKELSKKYNQIKFETLKSMMKVKFRISR